MSALPKIQIAPNQPEIAPFPVAPDLPVGYAVYEGRLFHRGIDLMQLVNRPMFTQGRLERPATPLYIRRLAAIRDNYTYLHEVFNAAQLHTGYQGNLTIAYASKANPSQPVVRTVLGAGAAYECSSAFDVDIVRNAAAQGWLDQDRPILANGFKIPRYANALIRLKSEGFQNVLPILDDLEELDVFAASGVPFEVGLRSRTVSEAANRFGLSLDDMLYAAERIAQTDHLHLTTYHAMQTVSAARGFQYHAALAQSLRTYAQVWRHAPSLHRFNFGGGLPARTSDMNFESWMRQTLSLIMNICAEEGIPTPELIFETGRYMVQDHAMKLFRVVKTRMGADGVPYYMIDGSIMSNFPDAWALGDKFTVLPVNHWDGEMIPVRLAGLTCDHDDVYPTRKMPDEPILMPANADGLIVGFFECGAYQETLGGRHGAKHCLLPEGGEMCLEENVDGETLIEYTSGQNAGDVLGQLGYS